MVVYCERGFWEGCSSWWRPALEIVVATLITVLFSVGDVLAEGCPARSAARGLVVGSVL